MSYRPNNVGISLKTLMLISPSFYNLYEALIWELLKFSSIYKTHNIVIMNISCLQLFGVVSVIYLLDNFKISSLQIKKLLNFLKYLMINTIINISYLQPFGMVSILYFLDSFKASYLKIKK